MMMPPSRRLERAFFERSTLEVARALLGQRLVRLEHGDLRTSGLIIETEAYIGTEDLGCHARVGRTTRNDSMWGPPGHAYVYFTYGMHWMLNFVTEGEGDPAAVLIRSLMPKEGLDRMRQRRVGRADPVLTDGPAKLCQALAIDRALDGHDLCHPASTLFVEAEDQIAEAHVITGPRIGLNSVPEPWKSIPWRFRVVPTHIALLTEGAVR
jgi:DNA-3-methyladenine glycosylase